MPTHAPAAAPRRCTYRNQASTTPKVPDDGRNAQRFGATVDYCSSIVGLPADALHS